MNSLCCGYSFQMAMAQYWQWHSKVVKQIVLKCILICWKLVRQWLPVSKGIVACSVGGQRPWKVWLFAVDNEMVSPIVLCEDSIWLMICIILYMHTCKNGTQLPITMTFPTTSCTHQKQWNHISSHDCQQQISVSIQQVFWSRINFAFIFSHSYSCISLFHTCDSRWKETFPWNICDVIIEHTNAKG